MKRLISVRRFSVFCLKDLKNFRGKKLHRLPETEGNLSRSLEPALCMVSLESVAGEMFPCQIQGSVAEASGFQSLCLKEARKEEENFIES